MKGGAHIGTGIEGVEVGQEPGQDVVPGEARRPQLLAVGEQEEDHQADGIGQHDEIHHPAESSYVISQGV